MRVLIPLVLGAALFGVARGSSDADDPLPGGLSDAMRDPAVMEQARRSGPRHRTQEPPRRAAHRFLTWHDVRCRCCDAGDEDDAEPACYGPDACDDAGPAGTLNPSSCGPAVAVVMMMAVDVA